MRHSNKLQYVQELVINWHLTEVCNYRCKYCYAKWDMTSGSRELIHDNKRTSLLLEMLWQFFQPGNEENPLAKKMTWDSVRLNLAGGEPLMYRERFISIVQQARRLGFNVSLITNASQLNQAMLNQLASHLSWLGISLDSTNPETNKAIGRISKNGQMLNVDRLAQDIHAARQDFPSLRFKINTVVNRLNYQEYFGNIINRFSPDKWKVLRVLPILDQRLSINNEQFEGFIARHNAYSNVLTPEDNRDMTESYLMIDPHGQFYQNRQGNQQSSYCYSQSILRVGVSAAFSEMEFDVERFSKRYMCNQNGEIA